MTARDAWGQVAHTLRILADDIDKAIDSPSREAAVGAGSPVPPPGSPAPARPGPDIEGSRLAARRQLNESAFTECPAHRQPFKEGRFGLYCSGTGEPDGNWYNDKGYCRVTPKSAGAWLKQHQSAA